MRAIDFLSDNFYLVILAGAPFFLIARIYFLIRKMSEPEKMLIRLNTLPPQYQQIVDGHRDWLRGKGLEPVMTRQFGRIQTVTFQQKGTNRFFSFYFHRRATVGVETYFDDTECTCLDTSTSGSVGMFPSRPHQYQQSFPNASPEEAWQRHLEAEAYLVKKFGLRQRPLTLTYEEILLKAVRLRMQFVRSIPFYPVRALYWYFVSRGKAAGRSIQQQFP